jgi:phosphomannomutase/phosphoglucomutase
MLVESFSGIRGLVKEDLTDDVIRDYALSFTDFLKKQTKLPKVVLGMDTRPSSNVIKELMKKTFLEQGVNVIDVGYNTTPAVQHGIRHFKADGGVMITASHNEPDHNGWKFMNNTGSVLNQEEIIEVIEDSKNPKSEEVEKGTVEDKEEELQKSYIDFVLDIIGQERINNIKDTNLKIIVDPNGGTAATIIKPLLEKLNIQVVEKNMELGVFNRLIEPNQESLTYLADEVEKSNADLGAGWDCDGDRVELVIPNNSEFSKERGRMLSGQYILALLVEEVLSEHKGENEVVVVNDATSNLITEITNKHNAKVVEVEVGEINVVEKMNELNAPVGGEGSSSGGIFPPSKCRDGILALIMILALIAKRKKKITEILQEFPKYYNSRTKMQCSTEQAIQLRKKLEEYWKDKAKEIKKTGDETGGLKIMLEDGWIWYRASKTEAGVFRIITDAKTKEKADELLEKGEKAFKECEGNI